MVELTSTRTINAVQWTGDNFDEVAAAVTDSEGNTLVSAQQMPDGLHLYVADKPSPDDANYRQLEVPLDHYVASDPSAPDRAFVFSPEEVKVDFGYEAPQPEAVVAPEEVTPVAEVTTPDATVEGSTEVTPEDQPQE